jgi:hypothetical protein
VSDSRSESASLENEAGDKPDPDVSGSAMSLGHDELENVAGRIGHELSVLDAGLRYHGSGDDLVRHDLDDPDVFCAVRLELQIGWCAITQVHGAARLRLSAIAGGLRMKR